MEPWLKMELTDPDALVHQCCSDWTVGPRGDRGVSTLREIWNGPGYRAARRTMLQGPISDLCRPICPRLHDRANEGARFSIIPGSPEFVMNQRRMLEDIAEGREELRSMPLNIGLCPSTYCNFDCIMCGYGRSPRRDIPDEVWDELPFFLPTLSTLVLLGGEPLGVHELLGGRAGRQVHAVDAQRRPAGVTQQQRGRQRQVTAGGIACDEQG